MPTANTEGHVRWWQLWWAILGCYAVSVFVTIPVAVCLSVVISKGDGDITQSQNVILDSDPAKSKLIEELAKEHDARLHSGTTGVQLGSGH